MRTVRAWLRLLVFYHSPAVAQHLDRVVPGWEGDCDNKEHGMSTSITVQAVINNTNDNNNNNNNNNNSNVSNSNNNNNNNNDGHNSDHRESTTHDNPPTGGGHQGENGSGGCLPLRWLCGFFTGSLPADQTNCLFDWAIINEQRYAGVFLIATLLEIFSGALGTPLSKPHITPISYIRYITSPSLLPSPPLSHVLPSPLLVNMTGADIRSWFQAIAIGDPGWPSRLSAKTTMTWPVFTSGWLHATAAVVGL